MPLLRSRGKGNKNINKNCLEEAEQEAMLPLRGKTKMLPFQAGGALKKQSFVFYGRGGLYEGSRGEGAGKCYLFEQK
jgi:hypothetical protein